MEQKKQGEQIKQAHMKHTVFISIGSNIGEKRANCERALNLIGQRGAGEIIRVARFYRTQPVDYTDQDWFVNTAAQIETLLSPQALFSALKAIERELGTKHKSVRFGPRIIDLDILLYDDLVINTKDLIIPHERMHERVFVLKPLCDINSEIIHPLIKRSIKDLLLEIEDENQGVFLME